MSADLATQTLAVIHAKRERDYELQQYEIDASNIILEGCLKALRTVYFITGGRFGAGLAIKRCADAIEGAKASLEVARTHVQHFQTTGQMR